MEREVRSASVALAAGCLLALLTFAPRAIVGVYQRQLLNAFDLSGDLASNWQAVQALSWGLCAPAAGALADRFGIARVAAGGAATAATAVAALMVSTGPTFLLLFAGIVLGAGLSAFGFPMASLFAARGVEGRAAGIVAASAAFSPFVFTPLAFALLAGPGWAGAVGCLSAALVMAAVVAARAPGDRRAAKAEGARPAAPSFVALASIVALSAVDFAFVSQRFQKYAFDAELAADTGAWLLVAFCAAGVAGAFAAGVRARDKPGPALAVVGATRLCLMVSLILAPATQTTAFLAAALHGATWLALWPPVAALASACLGARRTGLALGLCVSAWQFGGLAGGFAHVSIGASAALWWALAAATALAAAACLRFDPTPRRERP